MNYNEALAKLKACGQEHVLNHYDALSDQEKEALLAQVAQTDFSVTENIGREIKRGKISAIGTMELSEIKEREDEFRAKGLQAIREGKLAAVLLAGGMGTRLGSDNPKCMYDIGITKHVYIMQRLIENVMEGNRGDGSEMRSLDFLNLTDDGGVVVFAADQHFAAGTQLDDIRTCQHKLFPDILRRLRGLFLVHDFLRFAGHMCRNQ